MIRKIFLAAIMLVTCASVAQAGSLRIGMNDYSAEVALGLPLVEDRQGTSEISARGLYNSRTDTSLGEAGLDVFGHIGGLRGLMLGIGGRFFGADVDHEDVMAVALGGLIRFNPAELNGFGARARIFYAPRIFSFRECDRLLETGLEVDYEIMPRAWVYMAYGNTKVNTEQKGDIRADESIRIGAVFGF